jgi:hypothetical protein
MDIPQDWEAESTVSGDMVTIYPPSGEYPKVTVRTRQLGDVQPPSEKDELEELQNLSLENIKVKTIQWPEAQVAHEVTYEDARSSPKLSVLSLLLYGTSHYTFVDFEVPSEDLAKWEPTFRRMLATFEPHRLNVESLPGRP